MGKNGCVLNGYVSSLQEKKETCVVGIMKQNNASSFYMCITFIDFSMGKKTD